MTKNSRVGREKEQDPAMVGNGDREGKKKLPIEQTREKKRRGGKVDVSVSQTFGRNN